MDGEVEVWPSGECGEGRGKARVSVLGGEVEVCDDETGKVGAEGVCWRVHSVSGVEAEEEG